MTRKHFVILAQGLRDLLASGDITPTGIHQIGRFCALWNPRFDMGRFLQATGAVDKVLNR